MHGGNHHEAANYGLSSVYDKNRYSKKAQNYRRFKKGGQVLDVYSSKGEVKGPGVGGRELYDGPYKDMTIHDFFTFYNNEGKMEMEFKTNSQGISYAEDPEYQKWRSKDRGYSGDELIQWYMWTQAHVTPHNEMDWSDRSTWEGKNHGMLKTVKKDPVTGHVMLNEFNQPEYNDFNEDLHNDILTKKEAGDPSFSWYPNSQEEAFGMARDLNMPAFFYNGRPILSQTEEEVIQFKKERGNWWLTNKPDDLQILLENSDQYNAKYADPVDYKDLSREALIWLSNPQNEEEAVPFLKNVKRDFKTSEEALEFANTVGINKLGNITINGKPALLHNYGNEYDTESLSGAQTYGADISEMIYDKNLNQFINEATAAYMKKYPAYSQNDQTLAIPADNTRVDMGYQPNQNVDITPGVTFAEFFQEYAIENDYKPEYVQLSSDIPPNELEEILRNTGNTNFAGSSKNNMPAKTISEGAPMNFKLKNANGELVDVENPLHAYDDTAPQMNTLWGDIVMTYLGARALGIPNFMKEGVKQTTKYWANPGKFGYLGSAVNTTLQPLKGSMDYYKRSLLNKHIMEPAIPGTLGLGNLNTAANVTFTGISADQAVEGFSEGNIGKGLLNTGFVGLNLMNPYSKLQANYNRIPNMTGAQFIKTASGTNIPLKSGMGDLSLAARDLPAFSLSNKLPASILNNKYMPFTPKYTQGMFLDDFNAAISRYEKTNPKDPYATMVKMLPQ